MNDRTNLVTVPFSRPELGPEEVATVTEAVGRIAARSRPKFIKLCEAALEAVHSPSRAMLTHSCTAALELCFLMLDLQPGDEVIMPSFTFPSTANAVALRGAVPVFVDIRPDTLNLDEALVEAAITSRTRAILAVHYAGIAAEMDALLAIAARHGLPVVEDAAQGLGATYKGQALGAIGTLGALSFHETKNVIAGEGGCLLVRDEALWDRALIGRDKGTNKVAFQEGRVPSYTWSGLGSAYGMHEFTAAMLWAQLNKADTITTLRREIWARYQRLLTPLARSGAITLPTVPEGCVHNGHLFYVLTRSKAARDALLDHLRGAGIEASFHYIPLHTSVAGKRYGRIHGSLQHSEDCAGRLLRLPMFPRLTERQQDQVVESLTTGFASL